MLWLTPSDVFIDDAELTGVDAISVDRKADELIIEHAETGPQVIFADVVRQTVHVRIRRRVPATSDVDVLPGDEVVLRFRSAPSNSDARGRDVRIRMVISALLTERATRQASTQTIQAIAIASTPTTDPVEISG